jgi:4-hydroxy-2-oxoheptanedioate aldolase
VSDALPVPPHGVGAVVSIPYGPVAEWLAGAGYTWIVIDAEHAPIGADQQLALITATHAAGATAYIRVAANDERTIGFALDAGADGVIVPNVTTVAEAERAAAALRYPPRGVRSIGPIRRQPAAPCCIVQIETVDAVSRAAEITSVDGVDAVMIGPGDLALDAGLLPGLDSYHPTMLDLYRQVRDAAAACATPAGTFALMGHDDVRQASEQGWDFVVACLDRLALLGTASSLRKQAEDALAQSAD